MNRQLLLDVLPAPAPSLNNFIAGPNGKRSRRCARSPRPGALHMGLGRLRPQPSAARAHRAPRRRLHPRRQRREHAARAGRRRLQVAHAEVRGGGRCASHGRQPAGRPVRPVQPLARIRRHRPRLRAGRGRRPRPAVHAAARGPAHPPGLGPGVPPGSAVRRRQAGRPVRPGGRARHAPGARDHQLDADAPRARHPQAGSADRRAGPLFPGQRPPHHPAPARHARGPRLATQ